MTEQPAEMLLPPDIEGQVIALLTARMPTVGSIATTVPNPRPSNETYIRVTRTGGAGRDLVQTDPTVLIECWAPDSTSALDVARLAYGHLWAAYGGSETWGGRASFTEPVNFPDPDTTSPRYQFIATLTVPRDRVTD